jgi:hypothetical protein
MQQQLLLLLSARPDRFATHATGMSCNVACRNKMQVL